MTKQVDTLDHQLLGYVCLSDFLANDLPVPRTIIHPWLEGNVSGLNRSAT